MNYTNQMDSMVTKLVEMDKGLVMETIGLKIALTAFIIFVFFIIFIKSGIDDDLPRLIKAGILLSICVSFFVIPVALILFIWS